MRGDVNKHFALKSLLTTASNILPLHLKHSFPLIIWIFTEGEGDEIESRLPIKSFFHARFSWRIVRWSFLNIEHLFGKITNPSWYNQLLCNELMTRFNSNHVCGIVFLFSSSKKNSVKALQIIFDYLRIFRENNQP